MHKNVFFYLSFKNVICIGFFITIVRIETFETIKSKKLLKTIIFYRHSKFQFGRNYLRVFKI